MQLPFRIVSRRRWGDLKSAASQAGKSIGL
jgi:hypothetical protein